MSEPNPASSDATPLDPMLPVPGGGDTSDYSWHEAALPGAILPPTDVRIEIDDLKDESPRIRRLGARALLKRRLRYPQVVAAFRAALSDDDAEVRGLAAHGLADLDIFDAVPAVRKLLADPASWVRWQAAEALSKLGDTECLPGILEFIQDVPRWVKRLCESGKPEVLPTLTRALEIGNPRTKAAITSTLLKMGIELEPVPSPGAGWRYRLRHDTVWQPVRPLN